MALVQATILQIIPRLDTGGAELSTIEITEALVRAGARALVLTEGGRMSSRVVEAGGEIMTFPAGTKSPLRILSNARALAAIVKREGVSLIHARSRAPAWSALIAARRTGVPFVTTYHGAYSERGHLKKLYNSVMARSDMVIANSEYTGRLIRERYGTPRERVRVIHRGVDVGQFSPDAVAPERVQVLRAAWGVAEGQPIVLQAARLSGWKGQGVLIAAAGTLHAQRKLGDAVVILAGDAQGRDSYADSLRAQITALGLGDRVRLVGHVDDVAAAYLAAYLTVVPSIEPEAFGRAAAEAEAMGCPVIATNIGAPPETIRAEPMVPEGEITGWLVPPNDAATLAKRIEGALALSPSARKLIGDRARAHVSIRLTLEVMKRATLDVYDGLLGSHLAERFKTASF